MDLLGITRKARGKQMAPGKILWTMASLGSYLERCQWHPGSKLKMPHMLWMKALSIKAVITHNKIPRDQINLFWQKTGLENRGRAVNETQGILTKGWESGMAAGAEWLPGLSYRCPWDSWLGGQGIAPGQQDRWGSIFSHFSQILLVYGCDGPGWRAHLLQPSYWKSRVPPLHRTIIIIPVPEWFGKGGCGLQGELGTFKKLRQRPDVSCWSAACCPGMVN